jgi:hypothetical protein
VSARVPEGKVRGIPEASFWIHTSEDQTHYFVVHIAQTLAQMRETMKRHVGECHPRQVAGVVAVIEPELLPGLVGVIFFSRTDMGAGLVAHELAHAAFRTCDYLGIEVRHWDDKQLKFNDERQTSEELYARIVEHLTRDFWRQAYESGYAS